MPMTKESDDAVPDRQIDKDGILFVAAEKSVLDGYEGIRGIGSPALNTIAAHVKAHEDSMSVAKEFLDSQKEHKATVDKFQTMFAGPPQIRNEMAARAARRISAASPGTSEAHASAPAPRPAPAPAPTVAAPAPPTYKAAQLFQMVRDLELYGTIDLFSTGTSQFAKLMKYEGQYDRYCPECEIVTPWKTVVSTEMANKTDNWDGMHILMNQCQRRSQHRERIYIHFGEPDWGFEDDSNVAARIKKVGQMPSLAEFHSNDVAAFAKVTTRSQRSNYLKAGQAFSQGFAAGACTYLRRVVEGIMNEEHDNAMKENGISDWPEFEKADTMNRMKLLSDRLPEFLVQNPILYKVLSHGMHSLTDEECREIYPRLRESVRLVFADRLEKRRGAAHRARVARELAQMKTGRK